jgi:hypothetical protein
MNHVNVLEQEKQLTSSTGGLPQPPAWYPKLAPGGIGALSPGIFRCGYDGGGPYL